MLRNDLKDLKELNQKSKEKEEELHKKIDDILFAINSEYNSGFNYNIEINYLQSSIIIDIMVSPNTSIPNRLINEIDEKLQSTNKYIEPSDKGKLKLIFEYI